MPSKSLLSTVAEPYPLSGEADAPAEDSDQAAPVWWTVDIVIASLPSSSGSAYGEASAIETAALLRLPADMRALRSTQCRAPVLPADVSPAEAWELTQSFLRSIALTSVSTHSPPCAPQGYFYFDTDFNQYVQLTADTLSLASTLIRIVMVTTAVGFAEVKEVCPWSADAFDATADHAHENLILSQGPSACSHRLSTRTSQSLGHDDTTAQHLGNGRTKPGVTVAPPRSPGGCSASAPRHSSHPSALDETTGSRHHFNPVGETLSYRPHSRSGFEAEARPLETWTNFDPTDVALRHQGCFSQREDVEAEKLQHLTCPRAMGAHADEKSDFPVNWTNVGDTARSVVSQHAPSTSCKGRAGCHHHARYNSSARMETQDITADQGDMDSVKRTGDNEIAQHMEAKVVTQKAALRAARAVGRRHRSNRGSSSNTDSTNGVEFFHSAPPPLKPSANQLPSRSSTHDLPTQMGTSCRAPPRPPSAVHTQGYSRGVVAEEVRTPPSPPPPASALPQQQRFLDDPVLQRRVETPLGQTTSSLPCAAWSSESGGGGPYPIYAPSPPPMVPVSQSLAHGAYEPALHPYFDPPLTATTTTSVPRDRASLSLSSASFTEAFVKRIHGAQHDVLTALLQRSAQARQRAHCSGVGASATPAGVAMCTRSEVSHATSGADVNSAPAATMAAVGSTVPPLGASFCSSVSTTPPSSMPEDAAPRDVTDALSAFFKTRGSKGSDCEIPGYLTDAGATTTSGADEPFWGPAADGSDAVPAAGAQRQTYSARRPPANMRTGLSTAAGHAETEECDVPHASASVATHDASNGRSCRHSQEHFPSADARSAQVEDRNKMSFVKTEALVKVDYTCKEASNAPEPGMHSQVPPERIAPMPHVESPRGVPRVPSGGSSGVNNTAETNGAAVDDSIGGVGHHGMEARATVDFLVTDAVTEARDDEELAATQEDEREGGDEAKLLNAVEPETDVVLDGCGGGLRVLSGGGRGEAASSQQPCHYARLKDATENEARTAFRDTATAATQQTETTDVSVSPLSLHRGKKNTLTNAATMEMALNASAGVGADTLAPQAGLGGGGPALHSMAAAAELISKPVTSEAPPQVLRDLAAAAAVEDRTLHRQRERFATGGKGTGDGAGHVNATAEVESGEGRDEKFRSAAPEPATSATTRQTSCNSSPLMDTPTLIRKGSRMEEDVSVAATLGSGGRAGVLSDITDPGRRLLPTPRRGMPAANGDAGADDADVISYTYHEEVSPAAITAAAEGEADTTDKGGVCIDTSAAEVVSTCLSVASSLPVALPEAPSPPIDAGTGGDCDSLWKITVGAGRYIDTAEKKPHAKPPSSAVAEMGDPVPPLLDVSDVGGDNSAAVLDAPLITVISQCGAPDAPPLPTSQPHVPLLPPHQPRNDVAMRRTMVLLGFPGSAWEFIMTHYYEHMHEAFTSDSAVAANVPVSAIQDVRYSKGGLMVDLYVLHPVSLSEASVRELMSSYSYPTLWALYEAKKRERKQLLRSRGTSVVSETSGRSQPHPSTLALSPQEEVGWTGS
ncbi:hypothetical protein JKF63_04267 [Porcisia hertigi]|uniref:Flagellar attachment zone protein 1 conserved domain-containing protein n=1 Tax=Porcisia hertigi TaxID=2761500 RepID=A0A836L7P2_9TRYP|nr:hypothetical protein JKF63_04267 [Porcisia hertigi]